MCGYNQKHIVFAQLKKRFQNAETSTQYIRYDFTRLRPSLSVTPAIETGLTELFWTTKNMVRLNQKTIVAPQRAFRYFMIMKFNELIDKTALRLIARHFTTTVVYLAAYILLRYLFVLFLPEREWFTMALIWIDEIVMLIVFVSFVIDTIINAFRPALKLIKLMKNEELFGILAA